MLKNHFWTAIRQFRRNPVYSGLNIIGLAFGAAGFILIFLWVETQLGFDRAFQNADRVYRVTTDVRLPSGQNKFYALSTSGLAAGLKTEYPEVQGATRLLPPGQVLLRRGDVSVFETTFIYVDEAFLEVFPYRVVGAPAAQALKNPHSLLMTREMAEKYFGNEDPVGKTINVDNEEDFLVTGLFEKPRGGSHLRADFLANPGNAPFFNHPVWTALGIYTYVELAPGVEAAEFETRIQDLAAKYVGPRGKDLFQYRLQPAVSIHTRSDREAEFAPIVGIAHIRILSAAALLILLVACVNFINLATARAGRRAQEVGIRKVLGARRDGLFRQFLSESFLSTLASFGIGLGLALSAMPWFRNVSGVALGFEPGRHLPLFGVLAVAVGLLAGSYPSIVLSSFVPVQALRGKGLRAKGAAGLRKGLIVFQYATAIILIVSAGVVSDQMRYLRTKNLGFDKDQVLAVRLRSPDVIRDFEGLKHRLLEDPNVAEAAAASMPLGMQAGVVPYVPEGFDGNTVLVRTLFVDHDFIQALGMKIAAGRAFSKEIATDVETACIVNQTAAARFGWTEAVGKTITCTQRDEPEATATCRVIGVVEDFHVRSLRQEVEPVVMRLRPAAVQFLFLKLRGTDILKTTADIERKMKTLQPQFPPESFFLDDNLNNLYGNDMRLGRILKGFSILTVLIACLGLLGMTAYAAEQRKKEIGIRKVLGANISGILWLLGRESAGLVLLANLIAWPAAYLIMLNWLRNFAYRTSIGPAVMILSGAAALALAMTTVVAQAYRTAAADPVKSIRYE
ncbi:MAG: ABC transporter permease [Candidatus Aminicenantes bacterium]|nr:ABC transporter permease [Candidatus Aminicenantes bacterium]